MSADFGCGTYLLQLVLAHGARHLEVALDLLTDLLETVDDRHAGDGVDPGDRHR